VLVLLAEEHHWTPEQVSRMDEDYVTEVVARIRARNDVERHRQKRQERRERMTARWVEEGMDADVTEIR